MWVPALGALLPDVGLIALGLVLRGTAGEGALGQAAVAIVSGATIACLWSSAARFLLHMPGESKARNVVVGAIGAAVFFVPFRLFGEQVFQLHDILLRPRSRGLVAPPTELEILLFYVGAIGAISALVADRGLRMWR